MTIRRTPSRTHVFWTLQLIGWSAYAVALMVPWLGQFPLAVMWPNKLVIAGTGLATSSVLRLLYRRIAREGVGFGLPCATAVAASVIGAVGWNAAASTILHRSLQDDSVLLGALGRTMPRFDGVLYHALVLLTWSLLYFGARHYRALVAERERSVRAESLAREARLLALRYQIGPHFLFNALNAVSTLVVTDRKADATATIARLADLLRASLEPPHGDTTSLACEIDLVEGYVAIERVRFGDRLQVTVDVDPSVVHTSVPTMTLQPLVENAVRHAVALRDEPTRITIRARMEPANASPGTNGQRVIVSVSNDGAESVMATEGLGVGLANVRARLSALYGEGHAFRAGATPDGGFCAEIALPFVPARALDEAAPVLEAQLV